MDCRKSRGMLLLLVSAVLGFVLAGRAQAVDWPGTWVELETAKGDAPRASIQYASGHFAVDWQNLPAGGATLYVDVDVPAQLPGALLYLRYARDAKADSLAKIS